MITLGFNLIAKHNQEAEINTVQALALFVVGVNDMETVVSKMAQTIYFVDNK